MMNRIKDVETIQAPIRLADGDLLARFLKRRDDSAFAELVARHGRMVFGVCLRRLGQTADAEDAFQAVFLTLARHAEGLASRTTVGPWLYTVVRQVTTKALRSRRRRRWLPWGSTPEPIAAEPTGVDVDLDAALATLNEQERSAIVLCHFEGLSRSEAAKALGCPEGTLSARLSRGLEKLRKKLGKPPLAVLVAASLVMLPDELPANTVDLVHHFRNGALDDWASPGTLDYFRKADPMRYLHRAGPVVAAFAAVGLIMVGVSFGLNLIQAQDKPAKEKSRVVNDRGRSADSSGGIGPLGGSGSDDRIVSGGGISFVPNRGGEGEKGSGSDRGLGVAAGSLGGRRGGGIEGGDEGGGAAGQTRGGPGGRKGMGTTKSLFGGGGMGPGRRNSDDGVTGMMSSTNVRLADAVNEFNVWAKTKTIGKTQPPLTEDEVVAAILGWGQDRPVVTDELYKMYQQIAETRTMPNAWHLHGRERWKFNNREFDVWWIELAVGTAPNKVYYLRLRDQRIRALPLKTPDKKFEATDSAIITISLKNSNAESIAEVLSKAIDGKWLETKVTADSRTNSLIIVAPKSKEESIRKTVQALDDLQK